jgi:transposase-like protein
MARPRKLDLEGWRAVVDRAVVLRSARAAGAEVGVSEASVRAWAKRFGVELVGRPGRPKGS